MSVEANAIGGHCVQVSNPYFIIKCQKFHSCVLILIDLWTLQLNYLTLLTSSQVSLKDEPNWFIDHFLLSLSNSCQNDFSDNVFIWHRLPWTSANPENLFDITLQSDDIAEFAVSGDFDLVFGMKMIVWQYNKYSIYIYIYTCHWTV